jgi:glycosyltransferase involved in cell wall biosynthesis
VGAGSYEIVVADDASADRTGEIARGFAARGTRVVRAENRQISKTRNTGARAATGEVLIFVDADTCIDAAIVRAALAAIEKGAVGGGAGVSFDGKVPFWARVTLELFLLAFRLLRLTGGCFLFCTRTAFDRVGGWDETVYASEEILLCRALHRQGRFVILRQRVLTSGRKLRTHSAREIFWLFARAAFRGRKMLQSREGLDLWYARREEPGA